MNIKTLLWTYIVKPIKNLGGDKGKIRRQWKQIMGYDLDLSNPRTFNEKIQYLKLLERKPEYTVMADKYAAKKWIADRVGEEYVPKLLGVWNRAEDIDFDTLPDRFVLKTTHDSGGVIVVKSKANLDKGNAMCFLDRHLKYSHADAFQEKVYKHIPRRIIAEEFISDDDDFNTPARDYKFFCFNGMPKFAKVDKDRFSEHRASYFSLEPWQPLSFREDCYPPLEHPEAEPQPNQLHDMLRIAHKLSEGLPLLRVDFFVNKERLYVGELTFFPGAGHNKLTPIESEYEVGDMIDLSAWREYSGGIYLYIKKLRNALGLKGI